MLWCIALIGLLLNMSGASIASVEGKELANLRVAVENVRNSRGVVGVLIFNSPQGWPEQVDAAFRSKATPAHPGVTSLIIENLPMGEYAVVVLHDENSNMKLDRTFFGLPTEGWGMSNNPQARLSAPTFERARFTLRRDSRLRIQLNY